MIEYEQDDAVRILLVEDNVDDADLLKFELARAGMEPHVSRVETESAFRGALESEKWDVILSDYAMPLFDGMRAFRIAREARPDVPFIFVSGALGEERAVAAMRAGARDYIVKGSHYSRVCEAIRRELAVTEGERRRLEAERESERRLELQRVAIDATGASILEMGCRTDGSVGVSWSWNGAVQTALADDGANVSSWPEAQAWASRVIHPDDLELLLRAGEQLVGGAERADVSARACDAQGAWIDLQVFLRVVGRADDGTVARVIAVVLDVTERRELEAQFRQAQKLEAVGRLAGGVAHDFNNLLTVILGFAQLLGAELPAGSSARDDVDEIAKAARRASTLTGQLLAFARLRAALPRVISPAATVRGAERMLAQLLPAGIELVRNVDEESWSVQIDPGGLEQVVMNLVVNARDAMPDGGRIQLSVQNLTLDNPLAAETTVLPGEYVAIAVADDGEGMDRSTRSRIFEPFFTTKPAGKGTGLGLSVCFGIVNQVGGHILVDSTPGRGTTFRILLPRCADPAPAVESEDLIRELRGTERVIVVENDDQVRGLAMRALSDLGYLVRGAATGGQAVTLLADGAMPIDVVVCDTSSRTTGVADLQKRIGTMQPRPRLLLLSAASDDVAKTVKDEIGPERLASGVVQKPFTPRALAVSVRAVLERR